MIFSLPKNDGLTTSKLPDRIKLDPRAMNSFALAITDVFNCVERDDQRAKSKNRATR